MSKFAFFVRGFLLGIALACFVSTLMGTPLSPWFGFLCLFGAILVREFQLGN